MSDTRLNIQFRQGETYTFRLGWNETVDGIAVPVTFEAPCRMQIRRQYGGYNMIAAGRAYVDLQVGDGLTLSPNEDDVAGAYIDGVISPEVTRAMPTGRYVWDIFVTRVDTGDVEPLYFGRCKVLPRVTRMEE